MSICSHFGETCTAAKSWKKHPNSFFGGEGQGYSRSSMLTPLKSSSLVLVMISSMPVPNCNCFHVRRTNTGKIITFRGWRYVYLTPACAGVIEPKWSPLELLKSALNAENFMCRLSWSISSHFVAIHSETVRCSQKLQKNSLKIFVLEIFVLGRSRSSLFINLKSPLPVLACLYTYL